MPKLKFWSTLKFPMISINRFILMIQSLWSKVAFDDPLTCVDEPVADFLVGDFAYLSHPLLFLFGRVGVLKVGEKPFDHGD